MKKVTFMLAVLLTVLITAGTVIADLNDGLVAYYPFNGNANDESENGNHGTVNGGISYAEGIVGQAVKFNGTDSYIRIPNPFQKFEAQYTVSAWILTEGKGGCPFAKYSWNSTEGKGFALFFTNESGDGNGFIGSTVFAIALFNNYWGASVFPSYTMPVSKFEYISAVYNEGNIKLYINGTVVSEKTVQHGDTLDNSYDMMIGTYFDNNGTRIVSSWTHRTFSGMADELRIYNRALSGSEIKELYGSSQPAACADTDDDGVPDLRDKCPDTPSGSYTDRNGCPASSSSCSFDIKSDCKTGLEEAIYALQVIAGIRSGGTAEYQIPYIIKKGCVFTIYSKYGVSTINNTSSGGGTVNSASSVQIGDMKVVVQNCVIIENSQNIPVYEE